MRRDRELHPESTAHAHAAGMNEGMRVLSYLIAGVLLYGGIGWLIDRLAGTSFALPIGIVLGAAAAVYTIVRRFGPTGEPEPTVGSGLASPPTRIKSTSLRSGATTSSRTDMAIATAITSTTMATTGEGAR